MKIYLAGKIGKHDWRENIVPQLAAISASGADDELWPMLTNAISGMHDYAGPFFRDHSHGDSSHGFGVEMEDFGHGQIDRSAGAEHALMTKCLGAIAHSDLVFAWIDQADCYGTLIELGWAEAFKKQIVVAFPPWSEWSEDTGDYKAKQDYKWVDDMWFLRASVRGFKGTVIDGYETAVEAFKAAVCDPAYSFDSPIEANYWQAWIKFGWISTSFEDFKLMPQLEVLGGKYRLDFASEAHKIAIELDGYEYHSSKDAFTKDRQRQRELERLGWRFIRFSGQEIHRDVKQCVLETCEQILSWVPEYQHRISDLLSLAKTVPAE